MVLAILKIIHLMSMGVGFGGGVANAIVAMTAAPKDPALGGAISIRIGRISTLALVLLWITGYFLVSSGPGWGSLPFLFWIKLLAVAALTGCAVVLQVRALRPGPELAALAKKLGPVMLACSTLAIVLAVSIFG